VSGLECSDCSWGWGECAGERAGERAGDSGCEFAADGDKCPFVITPGFRHTMKTLLYSYWSIESGFWAYVVATFVSSFCNNTNIFLTKCVHIRYKPPGGAFEKGTRRCSIAVLHMEFSWERKTVYPSGGVFERTPREHITGKLPSSCLYLIGIYLFIPHLETPWIRKVSQTYWLRILFPPSLS